MHTIYIHVFYTPMWRVGLSFYVENLILQNIVIIPGRKGEVKVYPRTVHGGPEEEQMFNYTLSLTSALDEVGWSKSRPDRFYPWERIGTQ